MRIPLKYIKLERSKYLTAYIDITTGYSGLWIWSFKRGEIEICGFGVNIYYYNLLTAE